MPAAPLAGHLRTHDEPEDDMNELTDLSLDARRAEVAYRHELLVGQSHRARQGGRGRRWWPRRRALHVQRAQT